jgi:outer membrane protein assembly factor BamB
VEVDRADGNALKLLSRAKDQVAGKQYAEAIDTLVEVMEKAGDKLVAVTDRRFISVRDYCNLQLVSLPPEGLQLYRSRVDPQAQKLYEEGVAARDPRLLLDVLDRGLASHWGDSALSALGEIALEAADPAAARGYWERIVPFQPPAGQPRTWLGVPDTDLDLAGVRARLVLASILEGSLARARDELAAFAKLHPDARGRFGGVETNYVAALTALLAEAPQWPKLPADPNWLTFAGNPLRNARAGKLIDAGAVAWRAKLRTTAPPERSTVGTMMAVNPVAEDARGPLSYYPVVVGNLLLVNNLVEILAFDLATGKPAWEHDRAAIYEDQFDEEYRKSYIPPDALGIPRYTMTVAGDRLYARMGAAVTSRAREAVGLASGYLVALDLSAEGRLVWKLEPDEGWAFEGSPVVEAGCLFIAMRRTDIQPHLYVACFDAQTRELRWRQSICAAESPARGMRSEITHNLLTLHRGTLYLNTNLGAVAAIAARDGRVLWVSLYPRVLEGDWASPPPHASRDLTPCVFDRGMLLVAPADSRRIFAFDAMSGQIVWQSGNEVEDVVHLLGVSGDHLIASGRRLYWISLKEGEQGRVTHHWPDGNEKLGYGRGLLAGDCVLWPTRDKIYIFDQVKRQLKKEIPLTPRGTGGGNLLVAAGRMFLATANELVALEALPSPGETPEKMEVGQTKTLGER